MKILKGEIVVKYIGTKDEQYLWELAEPITVELSNGSILELNKGFQTDFASVPKVFWSAIAPIGNYNIASLIHDHFYTYHNFTRTFSDKEFLLWLNFLQPNKKIRNFVMYKAIRLFGQKRWNAYGNN